MQKFDEKSSNGESSVEDSIYEDARDLVRKNLDSLVKKRTLDDDELDRLAKLVRIYGSLKEDLRADVKDGIKNASPT